MTRKYNNSYRTKLALRTTQRIIRATETLLTHHPINEVTLAAIAGEANITVQTLIRHMGSREGCLNAVVQQATERIMNQRKKSDYHSVEDAVSDLVDHYEIEGKLILNLLTQEHLGGTFIPGLMQKGREFHSQWIQQCLREYISQENKMVLDSLIVVTDIFAWKILRFDRNLDIQTAKNTISNMIKKILEIT